MRMPLVVFALGAAMADDTCLHVMDVPPDPNAAQRRKELKWR